MHSDYMLRLRSKLNNVSIIHCLVCKYHKSKKQEHDTPMLVHRILAQPVVHNDCAGMCLENVLKVVRGVVCVYVCVVLCCVVLFWGRFLSIVLSRFNWDNE